MEVSTYPAQFDDDSPEGAIRKLWKNLSRKHPRLFTMVRETIDAIERAKDLAFLEASGKVERLHHCPEPIFVLKLPPTHSREGVVRIYFGYVAGEPSHIWLLAAELKHGTSKDDPDKIKTAIQQYRILCKGKEHD